METLGQRIRRLREAKRFSQQELATVLGVSMRTVSNWERDKNLPMNRLGALEQVLGASLTESQAAPADEDDVVTAVRRSRLTEDRQYDVIGYYKRQLREQDYETEGRRGA